MVTRYLFKYSVFSSIFLPQEFDLLFSIFYYYPYHLHLRPIVFLRLNVCLPVCLVCLAKVASSRYESYIDDVLKGNGENDDRPDFYTDTTKRKEKIPFHNSHINNNNNNNNNRN